MIEVILLLAWLVIFSVIVAATYQLHHSIKALKAQENYEKADTLQTSQNWFYGLIVIASVCGIGILYLFLKGTIYESHFFEWLNLTVRLIHITFGIAWI